MPAASAAGRGLSWVRSHVALSCLASLEGQGGQVVGLLPHHVSGALQSWLQQIDGRVRAQG
jgi:hypothetical protein